MNGKAFSDWVAGTVVGWFLVVAGAAFLRVMDFLLLWALPDPPMRLLGAIVAIILGVCYALDRAENTSRLDRSGKVDKEGGKP